MEADLPATARPRRRLRALLAFAALALGVYVFVRLDRSVAERLGPVGECVYDVFHHAPGRPPPLTAGSKRLAEDVKAMGGHASIGVTKPGYFGVLGQEEWVNVTFNGPGFDDAALARLAEMYGDRIGGLYLEITGVTDEGLRSLKKLPNLRHLEIRAQPRPFSKGGETRITDAGMAHIRGL